LKIKNPGRKNNIMKGLLLRALNLYQLFVSPFFPDTCKFHPTCSEYCKEAIQRFGVMRGLWMSVMRLLRCHPLSRGGFDPVAGNK